MEKLAIKVLASSSVACQKMINSCGSVIFLLTHLIHLLIPAYCLFCLILYNVLISINQIKLEGFSEVSEKTLTLS
jgi:hypothetical protein